MHNLTILIAHLVRDLTLLKDSDRGTVLSATSLLEKTLQGSGTFDFDLDDFAEDFLSELVNDMYKLNKAKIHTQLRSIAGVLVAQHQKELANERATSNTEKRIYWSTFLAEYAAGTDLQNSAKFAIARLTEDQFTQPNSEVQHNQIETKFYSVPGGTIDLEIRHLKPKKPFYIVTFSPQKSNVEREVSHKGNFNDAKDWMLHLVDMNFLDL